MGMLSSNENFKTSKLNQKHSPYTGADNNIYIFFLKDKLSADIKEAHAYLESYNRNVQTG